MPETPERSAMNVPAQQLEPLLPVVFRHAVLRGRPETPERSAMAMGDDTPPTIHVRAGAFPSLPGSPLDPVYHYLSSPVYLAELEKLFRDLDVIKGRIAYYKTNVPFLPEDAQYAPLIESINENILEICGPDAESRLPPTHLTFSDGAGGGKSKKKKSKKRKTKKKRRKTKKKRRKTRY